MPENTAKGRQLYWRARQALAAAGLALLVICLGQLLSSSRTTAITFSLFMPSKSAAAAGVTVVIDPGHGGTDSGAIAQGIVEKDLNLDVGLRVAQALEKHGVDVRLTRQDDRFVPLAERVALANSLPAAIFVSIHFNDSPGASGANGVETFFCGTRDSPPGWTLASLTGSKSDQPRDCGLESQRLAEDIQGAVVSGTTAGDRGVKDRALFVTRRVLAPAVLVEGGFVSQPTEARHLGDPAYRQQLAELIAEGIRKYLEPQPAATLHRT